MYIISHRGNSNGPSSSLAGLADIEKCLRSGYGIELDFRQYHQDLVISHDPPSRKPKLSGIEALDKITHPSATGSLSAINIKDEESLPVLFEYFSHLKKHNCFLFDFELALAPGKAEYWMNIFSNVAAVAPRLSANEGSIDKLLEAGYVDFWLDCWEGLIWYDDELVEKIHSRGGRAYAVSPDLHLTQMKIAELKEAWQKLLDRNVDAICTDYSYLLELMILEKEHD